MKIFNLLNLVIQGPIQRRLICNREVCQVCKLKRQVEADAKSAADN